MKLLKVFKFIFFIWLVLCLCVISAFLVLSFISKDRIYKADLNIAQKTILDSKEISYEAKIQFNSIFFRAQKNLSNIEIIDFGFADSMINDNAGGGNLII